METRDDSGVVVDAVDDDGELVSVGTFSFVLDHEAKTIEIGRGAIAKAWQRRRIPALAIGPIRALLATVPEYAVIIDATTLARGAKMTADAVGAPAVALHPSNFTVQPGSVDGWHAQLELRRGPELAHALLRRSPRTKLGRFMTSFHCRRPKQLPPARPVLTAARVGRAVLVDDQFTRLVTVDLDHAATSLVQRPCSRVVEREDLWPERVGVDRRGHCRADDLVHRPRGPGVVAEGHVHARAHEPGLGQACCASGSSASSRPIASTAPIAASSRSSEAAEPSTSSTVAPSSASASVIRLGLGLGGPRGHDRHEH